jgi:ABC-type nitrate/sulfonate/bicarbonate transport system substrate-binding protein
VPEHFNLLWQMPYTKEVFRNKGIHYEWIDFPGGTGAMSEALRKGEIDIAIMLTEGAIAGVVSGEHFKIRLPFVLSPLIWGVFVNAQKVNALPDFDKARFAVSRMNSGSHLMAKFYAQREAGRLLDDSQFVITQNIDGARQALKTAAADYFLWEKYMTAVWVKKGEFFQVGEITAPWPAFVFVTREQEILDFTPFAEALQESLVNFYSGDIMDWINPLSEKFNLSETDAQEWLRRVKYYDGSGYWPDRIMAAAMLMRENGMINKVPRLAALIVT